MDLTSTNEKRVYLSYEREETEDHVSLLEESKGPTEQEVKTSATYQHETDHIYSKRADYEIKAVDVAFLHSDAKAYLD